MSHYLSEKADAALAYGTSGGVGTAAAFMTDWRQWVLFGIAVLIGLSRLAYDVIKLRRLIKNKKAIG